MSNIKMPSPYSPGDAENGKFAVIDPSWLQSKGYPTDEGIGRFAILTYQINNPTKIVTEEAKSTISSYACSITIEDSVSGHAFNFDAPILCIEIFNNSTDKIYFQYGDIEFDSVVENGMIIKEDTYYKTPIEFDMSSITIATSGTSADIRMLIYTH